MTKRERKYLESGRLFRLRHLQFSCRYKLGPNAKNPYKAMIKLMYEAKKTPRKQIFWAINWDSETGVVTANYSEPITVVTIPLTPDCFNH